MSFKVGQRVTVVGSGKQYSSYGGWIETYAKQWINQWKRRQSIDTSLEYTVVAKGKHEDCDKMLYLIQCDDKVYIIGEQGIKAVETVGFKVGDEVKVIDASGSGKATLGDVVTITNIREDDGPPGWWMVDVKTKDGKVYDMYAKRFELVTAQPKVLTLKEAMKQCLDGHKVVPVNHNHPKSHMFFDECKGFMWYSEPLGYTEKAEAIFSRTQWVLWTAPPKFTVNSLVYNNDGTIGRVVEDKGVYNGIRKYSVSFNAIRDTVKSVDEAELTEYKQ